MQLYGLPTDQSLVPLKLNEADFRSYQIAVDAFKILGVQKVQLLTNNPKKFELLTKNGIQIVQRQLSIKATQYNQKYLLTKKQNMGHSLLDPLNDVSQNYSPTKIAQVVNRIHQQINSSNVDKFEQILSLNKTFRNLNSQNGFAAFFGQKKHPKYFFLSNFYEQRPIQTQNEGWFRCSQGLYQYQKFKHLNDLQLKDQMQKFNGQKSFKISRQLSHKVVKDWDNKKVQAMKYALRLKFSDQNLKVKLLETGSRYIVQNCHKNFDPFWADNGDGTGKNMMGVLLMELRGQLGGRGIAQRPKIFDQFYNSKCIKCEDPCLFDNEGVLHKKCVYHSGLLEN